MYNDELPAGGGWGEGEISPNANERLPLPAGGGWGEGEILPNRKNMQHEEATLCVHPAILARAKELRRPMTPQEMKLWQRLRKRQLYGLKFRRQHPIFRFILDFFCYEKNLVIEIDGNHHAQLEQSSYDQARTEWLEQQGLKVIRFTNRDIDTNLVFYTKLLNTVILI